MEDDQGECGENVEYEFTASTGELRISGTGNMEKYPWLEYKNDIKSVIIESGILNIVSLAFFGCVNLQSVDIPNTVESIGRSAFRECENLTEIIIPNSVTSIGEMAFYSCENLTSINIPEKVKTIGNWAFNYCKKLPSIFIPASVKSIDGQVFSYCDSMTSIEVNENNEFYKSVDGLLYSKDGKILITCPKGKTGDVSILKTVEEIQNGALNRCTKLNSVTIPYGIKSIEESTFYYCYNLTSIKIPDSVTSIGDLAFNYCGKLSEITIPENLESIGRRAFEDCDSLTSIRIPAKVDNIGEDAFNRCDSLLTIDVDPANNYYKSIEGVLYSKDVKYLIKCPGGKTGELNIADGVTEIQNGAIDYYSSKLNYVFIPSSITSGVEEFRNCNNLISVEVDANNDIYKSEDGVIYSKDGKNLIFCPRGKIGEVNILESVEIIKSMALSYCSKLTSITMPESLTSIEDGTFSGCSGLTSIKIPKSVNSIGRDAFGRCSNLTSIKIPANVDFIADYAFSECTKLSSVSYEGTLDPKHGDGVFSENCPLKYVLVFTRYLNKTFCGLPVKIFYATQNIPCFSKFRRYLVI